VNDLTQLCMQAEFTFIPPWVAGESRSFQGGLVNDFLFPGNDAASLDSLVTSSLFRPFGTRLLSEVPSYPTTTQS